MRCLLCQGEMEKSLVSYTIDRKGYHLYIEKVPAMVCTRCGERYFDEQETEAIQGMIRSLEEKLKDVQAAA